MTVIPVGGGKKSVMLGGGVLQVMRDGAVPPHNSISLRNSHSISVPIVNEKLTISSVTVRNVTFRVVLITVLVSEEKVQLCWLTTLMIAPGTMILGVLGMPIPAVVLVKV